MKENQIVATSVKEAKVLGLTTYFTGKPCPKGHITTRQTADWKCSQCKLEYNRERYKKDPSIRLRMQARKVEKYHSDEEYRKQKIAETAKWVAENKERIAAYHREYYKKNKESFLEKSQASRIKRLSVPENLEKERERQRAKKLANPEQVRADGTNRRAIKRGAEGRHNKHDIARIMEDQLGMCVYCLADVTEKYHADHVTPLCRGGTNWPDNIQLLCPGCNLSKHKKTDAEFIEYRKKKPRILSGA